MLRFLTAGESHGQALVVIVEGLPAGLTIDPAVTAADLKRRQGGYGRGRRMAIESDTAEVLSGIRKGETLGGPVALLVRNRDWTNWQNTMYVGAEPPADATGARKAPVTRPRPGHADLAGALKYERDDMRDVLERASARETTTRVAAGGLARALLAQAGVEIKSHVVRIGAAAVAGDAIAWDRLGEVEESPVRSVAERRSPVVQRAGQRGESDARALIQIGE